MTKAIPWLLSLGLLGPAVGSAFALFTIVNLPHPVEPASYTIKKGSGFRKVLVQASESGVIRFPRFAEIAGRLAKINRPKTGTYRLPATGSDWDLIKIFHYGHVETTSVTTLEGWTTVEIAERLDSAGVTQKLEFLRASTSTALLNRYGIVATEVEGYLFPETYRFAFDLPADNVMDVMLNTFFSRLPSTYETMANHADLAVHDAIILASIIQKESFVPAEMPTVSSVYHNRLRKSWPLQADPTVIYRMPGYQGDITYKMKRTKTPYNTYVITGLPAGPIGNPGLDAILAAANPVESKFMFFLADGKGTHDFSITLREHNRKILLYGLNRRKKLEP